jgi:hypothetical protein
MNLTNDVSLYSLIIERYFGGNRFTIKFTKLCLRAQYAILIFLSQFIL